MKDRLKVIKWREDQGRQKGKHKDEFKEFEKAFLEDHAQDLDWLSEEDFTWWSRGKRYKKEFQKKMKIFE